jgi:hypothetical protein
VLAVGRDAEKVVIRRRENALPPPAHPNSCPYAGPNDILSLPFRASAQTNTDVYEIGNTMK